MVTKWKTKENYPRKLQGKSSSMKQIHHDKRSFIILRKTHQPQIQSTYSPLKLPPPPLPFQIA